MAYYRLYFLGGGNGPIFEFREFEVAADDAAIILAEGFRRIGAMELWCGARKIRRWEPIAAQRQAPPPLAAARIARRA
jgi:hypothetical protein